MPKTNKPKSGTTANRMAANNKKGIGGLASKEKLRSAMHEVFTSEPSTVTRAKVSPERKREMKIAIGYAKARKSGAKLPKK